MNKNRQQDNFQILDILFEYLKRNPDIRFGQALYNLNLATHRREATQELQNSGTWKHGDYDIFFEEPENTLLKLRQI